jgi:hypothetical protein
LTQWLWDKTMASLRMWTKSCFPFYPHFLEDLPNDWTNKWWNTCVNSVSLSQEWIKLTMPHPCVFPTSSQEPLRMMLFIYIFYTYCSISYQAGKKQLLNSIYNI